MFSRRPCLASFRVVGNTLPDANFSRRGVAAGSGREGAGAVSHRGQHTACRRSRASPGWRRSAWGAGGGVWRLTAAAQREMSSPPGAGVVALLAAAPLAGRCARPGLAPLRGVDGGLGAALAAPAAASLPRGNTCV